MPYNSVFGRSCKHRLAPAIRVAILIIVCTPAAQAQLTWTIEVSKPSSGTTPKYDLSCRQTGTTHTVSCPNTDPTKITVNRNDAVYWQIGSASNFELWIVHEDPIVDDTTGHATHHHHAKKGTVDRDGGDIDLNAPISATTAHKYSVFAYDLTTKVLYYDDPRIIIGGSGLETSLSAIEMKCKALLKKLENSPNAEDASNLCQQIKALEESLGPKKEK